MMAGTILGKRYRILERVGGGGMALVFRAEDIYLGRPVALKVLRSQYAADEDFVRRFRREAQSAASLSHPNIVGIYDVGEEDDLYYIVMELVEGRTLKSRIHEEPPLGVEETARIGIEILVALAHAHAHKIVHRDIKPHNILLARDGRVKVTDFGIARAVTTDTVTNTGSILGSAHYFSPEMARGQSAGEKSDLYSLGVVLYEMVTGRVPFQGESPISVALMHVQEEVLPPSALNPEVPVELEEIILRAMEKEPADRYAGAEEMRRDLERFLEDYRAGRTRKVARDFPTQDFRALRNKHRRLAAANHDSGEAANPTRRGVRWGLWITLVLLLSLIGGGVWAGREVMRLLDVPEVVVPQVVGLSATEAGARLSDRGLRLAVVDQEYSTKYPTGTVTWQAYDPGINVKQGREVGVKLSKGPRQVAIPKVTGLTLVEARDELIRNGLKVGTETEKNVVGVDRGRVAEQLPPAGQSVNEGTAVDLVVSKGALEVPNVIGLTLDQARQRLQEAGLAQGRVDRRSDPKPKDTVLDQTPRPQAQAKPGDQVDLVVSQGANLAVNETVKTIEVRSGVTGFVTVKVVLTDATNQPRTVHEQPHPAGEKFQLAVRWQGEKGKLSVFINGGFAYDIPLEAGKP